MAAHLQLVLRIWQTADGAQHAIDFWDWLEYGVHKRRLSSSFRRPYPRLAAAPSEAAAAEMAELAASQPAVSVSYSSPTLPS